MFDNSYSLHEILSSAEEDILDGLYDSEEIPDGIPLELVTSLFNDDKIGFNEPFEGDSNGDNE